MSIVDLGLAPEPTETLRAHFNHHSAELVGVTVRNVDDSFWPSAQSFLPPIVDLVGTLRRLTDAKIVLGGVGFSIFARQIVERTGADYGIRGDGEQAIVALYHAVCGRGHPRDIPGLLDARRANAPAWDADGGALHVPTARDALDNATYLRLGGQIGLETKRGCPEACAFCADPLAKGRASRLRPPVEVADEAASLLRQGVDVLHLCDGEFNIPVEHARAVCDELIRRGLGPRLRWYAYMAVVPFDADLARAMRQAGCVGVNFTGPAATDTMLRCYGQHHRPEDIAAAVSVAHAAGITVMLDMLLGGPGETPQTIADAVDFLRRVDPDCVGMALGVRLYPNLPLTRRIAAAGPLESSPAVHRRYPGEIDLLLPTFYISPDLGEHPAALVRDRIGGDRRFFEPRDEVGASGDAAGQEQKGYNYNDNETLVRAIAAGARGAYWDILRTLRGCRGHSERLH